MKWLLLPICIGAAFSQTWIPQQSGSNASLRGVSAVSAEVAWASGAGGTYLKTTDGGATWKAAVVPGADQLDFRDVHAIDDRTAYLLSSGTGDKSRIYKTTDGGAHWDLQFTNPDPKGFFDAFAFWDAKHGIVLGDPTEGEMTIFTTEDAGVHWKRQHTLPALPAEGAFAASGTCLIVFGKQDAWFGTGGPRAARVFHSKDRGRTWTIATTPIRNDGPSAGIFSLAFSDSRHGIAVGGDYSKAIDATRNIATTSNGGLTWQEPNTSRPPGFRSAVAFLLNQNIWITTGPSGSDISTGDGATWRTFDNGAYNAISFTRDGHGWAVGPQGRIAGFTRKAQRRITATY